MEEWVPVARVTAAAATGLLAVLTFLYVRATREAVKEMRLAREAQQVPFVVAYLEPAGWGVWATVENTGRSPAFDVRVQYADPAYALESVPGPEIFDLRFLPAGARSRRLFTIQTMGTKAEDYPPIEVQCRWQDREGDVQVASSYLDYGAVAEGPSGGSLHDVTAETERHQARA